MPAIEWLDNKRIYYTARDAEQFSCEIGLEPTTTPFRSSEGNGMSEVFVRALKRDYVRIGFGAVPGLVKIGVAKSPSGSMTRNSPKRQASRAAAGVISFFMALLSFADLTPRAYTDTRRATPTFFSTVGGTSPMGMRSRSYSTLGPRRR